MATPRFHIMARSGPEDSLQAAQLPTNSSPELTAGPDWAIVRNKAVEASSLHYKDFAEAERLAALVESNGTESKILRDLADSRYVCTQPRFALQMCKNSVRAHQVKQCTPAYVEALKCQVKLARAVDTLCRPQFTSLTSCLNDNKGAVSSCVPKLVAFDQCTEDF